MGGREGGREQGREGGREGEVSGRMVAGPCAWVFMVRAVRDERPFRRNGSRQRTPSY